MKPLRFHHANLAKHAITEEEVKECLARGNRKYVRKVGRDFYRVIAQTAAGRYLEVLYKDLEDVRFAFHALDARPRDKKLLQRRGKRR
jgi:hypothetical protein